MKRTIKRNVEADEVSLFEAFDAFVLSKEAVNLAPKTIDNYKATFGVFTKYFELDSSSVCSEITEQKIFQWINHMKNNDCSVATINHYLRDIRTFLYWCMEKEYVQKFKIRLLVGQEEQIKYFDDDELEKLLVKPRRSDSFADWRTYAVVNFILATGARASTIINIRIEDINFARKEIIYQHTKNRKAQTVPLSSSLETVLREYMRMWRSSASGWLFCNVGEEQLTTNALRLAFVKYCKEREVEHTSIHGLRHSFARGWILNNGNTLALKNILGHQSTTMVSHYAKVWGEDLKQGYEDFSPLDQLKKSKSRKQVVKKNEF